MPISCPKCHAGTITYLGKDRCRIRRRRWISTDGKGTVTEKDMCDKCGAEDIILQGRSFKKESEAEESQAPNEKVG